MVTERKRYSVADLVSSGQLFIGDGYRAKNAELGSSGIPFARITNINDGFHFEGADRFPVENLARVGNKISQVGDVVFTSKGSVGRLAYVDAKTPQFVYSPQLCYWRALDPNVINSRFLFYWMQGNEFIAQYCSVMGQTDMANYVSLADQRKMHITIPSPKEQNEIVGILGVIDDKIAVNKNSNSILEAIARALFKSWFIDFDPVRAKAEGKQPFGMDEETAALLPSEFEGSELGEIPKGWIIKTIGEMCDVVGGSTPSTKEPSYWGDEHFFVTPKDMSSLKSPFILSSERRITNEGLKRISSGLLPIGTVILSSRAPIGYLAIAEVPISVNQGIIAMVPNGKLPSSYLLFWTEANMDTILRNANGSTFQEISKSNFRPITMVVPPKEIVSRFNAFVEPLLVKAVNNLKEISTLAAIRDDLLPKLLSGEIRVPMEAD